MPRRHNSQRIFTRYLHHASFSATCQPEIRRVLSTASVRLRYQRSRSEAIWRALQFILIYGAGANRGGYEKLYQRAVASSWS